MSFENYHHLHGKIYLNTSCLQLNVNDQTNQKKTKNKKQNMILATFASFLVKTQNGRFIY